jgi:hypothetical protein
MPIEQAEFGRTGHHSTRVIFGAACLPAVPQRVTDESRRGVFPDSVGDVGPLPRVLDAGTFPAFRIRRST